jgi:phosphoribosylamine--glycine ligase
VVEEYVEGREVSVFAFTDGEHISSLVAACDYKRLLDGDAGSNTGGMGSYTPPEFWTAQLEDRVRQEIVAPVVHALAESGTPYQGVLYAGLMITSQGPKVIEFNCRLGDPEAQVILPMLRTDLMDVVLACIHGEVGKLSLEWYEGACVGVVMASGGYPGEYSKGLEIGGLGDVDSDVQIFHSGTRLASESGGTQVLTDGGRVLTVVGRGPTIAQAREKVYDNVRRVCFRDAHYRKDIALTAGYHSAIGLPSGG